MKHILSKTAFTLIELIVSLVLISIVLLGVFAINSVLSSNNQDYAQKYLVKSSTQTALNHILNDAYLAVGSGTNVGTPSVLDQGILTGLGATANTFCIHQNPGVDRWVCYTFDNTVGDATYKQISYCNETYTLGDLTGNRGAGDCPAGSTFLGTAFSVAPAFVPATGNFSITIQNCLNDSLATCSATGTSTDPANNQEVQLSGSVIPPQEGTS